MNAKTTSASSNAGIAPVLWALGLVGAALTAGSFAYFGVKSGFSTGLGVLLAAGNLWVIAKVISGFLTPDESKSKGGLFLITLIKFAALFGGVFALLRLGAVDILALGVGYAALPLGIVLGQFKTAPSQVREGN
ncbi:MAG: ATP synthase subunit I [Myxococcales bacterium]|nr:ATP synthase subunit I [Myxococcales bacterium]